MVATTNPRVARSVRSLMALQGAKGTPASDFTVADSESLWTESKEHDHGRLRVEPGPWMTSDEGETVDSDAELPRARGGRVFAQLTPKNVELLLRNSWGPLAAGAFTLDSQVNEHASFAWVEDRFLAASPAQRLVRIYDAWTRRLEIAVDSIGKSMISGMFAGERRDFFELDAVGGLTLPAAPMTPGDRNVFAGRSASLVLDPTGLNVPLPFDTLLLSLDQQMLEGEDGYWDMMRMASGVFKQGKPIVQLQVSALLGDQWWDVIDDLESEVRNHFRLTLTAPSPAKTFTVDLYEVAMVVEPLRYDGQTGRPMFTGTGRAYDDKSGNFVDLTLT